MAKEEVNAEEVHSSTDKKGQRGSERGDRIGLSLIEKRSKSWEAWESWGQSRETWQCVPPTSSWTAHGDWADNLFCV